MFSPTDRVTTLFCAEPLRPMACCVLDSLSARGWHATIETGDAARNALRRFRDPSVGLRVLCVPDPIPAETASALTRALDPYNRKDLLVLHFKTPRDVIEAIENFVGIRKPRRHRARPPARATRSYLSHQTLVEQQLQLGRWSGYGLATAAATTAVAAALHFGIPDPRATPMPTIATVATGPSTSETVADPTSPLIDRSVLSAAQASPLDDDARGQTAARPASATTRPTLESSPMPAAQPQPSATGLQNALDIPADIEDLGELPLEDLGDDGIFIIDEIPSLSLAPVGSAAGLAGSSLAGAPLPARGARLQTIDPFAMTTAPAQL